MQQVKVLAACSSVVGVLLVSGWPIVERLSAQTPARGEVVSSSGVISPIVTNYDQTLAFYGGLLGLQSPPPRIISAKDTPFPVLLNLQGLPEARMKWSHVTIPGTTWWSEPLEYGDVDRQPVQPRLQDPGVATTILYVRDVDAMLARLRKAGTPVVTPGLSPVQAAFGASNGRAILVRDPDGYLVELVQPPTFPADAPAADVIGAGVRLTIGDTERTMRVYRDIMGFQPHVGSFVRNEGYASLTGVNAEVKLTTAQVPGEPSLTFEFAEFRGLDRKPMRTRIQDPGSMKFQFVVRNVDAAAAKLTSAGGTIVSVGGKQVNLGAAGPHIIVRDPNNFYLILQQQPQPK
jgi:catechol 2,3-dioxygenase-like lactoylglutathione lyase family enzyme